MLSGLVLLALVAWPTTSAQASAYFVFTPEAVQLGAQAREVYTPRTFEAHAGLGGPALIDASMSELKRLLPDAAQVDVTVRAGVAQLELSGDRPAPPELTDRALGAVYHTLRMTGVSEVRLGTTVLGAASFSRAAVLPVAPLVAALPPRDVSYGYVLVGDALVPAASFYDRLAQGDDAIRDEALRQLGQGSTSVKLLLLEGIFALRLKDRHAAVVPRLQDTDLSVRMAALELLRDVGDAKTLKALEDVVYDDPSPLAKTTAARILVSAGRTNFKKYLLLEKLKSADAAEVLDAARQLMGTGDAKLSPAFVEITRHSNPQIRQAGVNGLRTFKQYALMEELIGDKALTHDVAEPLALTLADEGDGPRRVAGINWRTRPGISRPAPGW